MTIGNFSQKGGVFKIPDKEGSVFTVNLPDGSPRYILLQKVDDLVELLQENYQGGKEPINPIEELDGLISIIKEDQLKNFVPYTKSTFAKRLAMEDIENLMDVLKQEDTHKPHTATDPPVSSENKQRREESHEVVPPVQDSTHTASKFDTTALQTERSIASEEDIIKVDKVNEGTESPVPSTYAGDWTILREVKRRNYSEEPQLCMQAAHMAARINAGEFVQGTVIGEDDKRIVHAWAEIGDFAYDAVRRGGGLIMPIDEFYETHKAEDVKKMSSLEAEYLHYKYDRHGFWGPYEDDEIADARESTEEFKSKSSISDDSDEINKVLPIVAAGLGALGTAAGIGARVAAPAIARTAAGVLPRVASGVVGAGGRAAGGLGTRAATGVGGRTLGVADTASLVSDVGEVAEAVTPKKQEPEEPTNYVDDPEYWSVDKQGRKPRKESKPKPFKQDWRDPSQHWLNRLLSGVGEVAGDAAKVIGAVAGTGVPKPPKGTGFSQKQMVQENPPQQPIAAQAPPMPDDMVYSSQNKPPSDDIPKHTGTRGGEYWLRSEALKAMNWNEDQLNEYLNTEDEEIQSENLEDLQAQLPEVTAEVKQLRGEKNRKYKIYQSAKRAMEKGQVSDTEVEERRNAYRGAKDAWEEGRVKLDLLNEKIEGLTSDAIEMPSEESTQDIEPEIDTTIENLRELLKQDPEGTGQQKADILAILDEWSEKEREARSDIHDDEEYYANSDVQSAIEAVTAVAETTNWRNLEALSEIPMVSDMQMEGQLDSRIGVLNTRLNAYKTIGSGVLEYFEQSYSLPSFDIEGNPTASVEGDWRQSPMSDEVMRKAVERTGSLGDSPLAWFSETQLRRKIVLSQMSDNSKRQYDKHLKESKKYGDAPPDRQEYLKDGVAEEVTFGDIVRQLPTIYMINNSNKSKGLAKTVPFNVAPAGDANVRFFDLSAGVLDNIEETVLKELPDKFGPPSVSSKFRNSFKEAGKAYADNPSTETDHLVTELYNATKFSKFHSESSSEMEKSTNSLLGGLIKDAIGTLTGASIVHHGNKSLKDREGNLISLEEGYKKFPKKHVSEYVKSHKKLTRQLLDFMYPNVEGIELYRGTHDTELKAFAEPAIEQRKKGFFKRLMKRGPQGTELRVEHNPVTQFSSSPLAAYDFASDQRVTRPPEIDIQKPMSEAAQGQGGIVLVQQVSKDDIWSSFGTGHGGVFRKGTEREFYVLGRKQPSTATAYLPNDFREYVEKQGGVFSKQQEQLPQNDVENKDLVMVIDDEINSDWIQLVNELWEDHPDLGTKSKMSPIKVDPVEMDEVSFTGPRTGMPKIPVEQQEIIETTPTVQKALLTKQQELGQTLAQADPVQATTPTEESPIHPAAQGKVRTVIFELVHRAGKTFERRRTAWVNPKIAEAINSRQKASDWLRLLGNYLPLYFVGGFVRDKLLGKVSKDVDIIALVPLDKVQESFDSLNIEYKKVNAGDKKILTLKVAGMEVDVASAEAEDLPKDLMKRDFTINAVAQSVTGQFYDPSNGLEDIKNKILRSPRNQSDKRFKEDPVRMIRAARFVGSYKLEVHSSVIRAINKNKDLLKDVPKARIGREVAKMMQVERPHDAMEFMAEHDLLSAIDPAMAKMVGYKQNTPHHKWDLWKHTMTALKKAESEDMVLNLAILFHDIGKPDASNEEQGTFHGHEKHSAEHVAQVLEKIELPTAVVKRVENLVAMHMRLLTIPEAAKVGAFRRIKIQAGEDLGRLIELAKADIQGSGVDIDAKLKQLDVIIAKLNNLEDVPQKENLSPITGTEIIEGLDIEAGPKIGEIKEHLHNLVVDDDLKSDDKEGAIREARTYLETVTKEIDSLMGLLTSA